MLELLLRCCQPHWAAVLPWRWTGSYRLPACFCRTELWSHGPPLQAWEQHPPRQEGLPRHRADTATPPEAWVSHGCGSQTGAPWHQAIPWELWDAPGQAPALPL